MEGKEWRDKTSPPAFPYIVLQYRIELLNILNYEEEKKEFEIFVGFGSSKKVGVVIRAELAHKKAINASEASPLQIT